MFRTLSLAAVAAAGVLILAAQSAQAYCVYNYTDGWGFKVTQTANGGHRATIIPIKGAVNCCNWETSNCNTNGSRTASVTLHLQGSKQDMSYTEGYRGLMGMCGNSPEVTLEAGGWVEIYPGNSNTVYGSVTRRFHCVAYGVNGQVTNEWRP